MKKLRLSFSAMLVLAASAMSAAPSTQWYRDARFGMFIHWGLYSQLANNWNDQRYYGIGEWLMLRAKIPVKEYEKTAAQFNPVKFDADAWVALAKQAGMQYIIITAKHHDGFAMFDSKVSDYNIVKRTPFGRDPLKELAEACQRQGIKLGFYYSQTQDWHNADAVGNTWDFDPAKADFKRYLENKAKPQLNELLTHYGSLGMIWFDTPQGITPAGSQALVDFVHHRQPDCLTTSRVGNGLGDYVCLQDHQLPDLEKHTRPVEALFTHNDSWGYTQYDKNYRSPREIVRLLTTCISRGSNLLFNIGPKGDGSLPTESVRDLKIIGDWMQRNGDSVHGAGRSPFPDSSWGVITAKPGKLYLHVHDYPPNHLIRLAGFDASPTSARLLATGQAIALFRDGTDLMVHLPVQAPDDLDTVVELEYAGGLHAPVIPTLADDMTATLDSNSVKLTGSSTKETIKWHEEFGDWKYAYVVNNWTQPGDQASWKFRIAKPDTYYVQLDYVFHGAAATAEGKIAVGDNTLYFEPLPTGDLDHSFVAHRIGVVHLKSGENTFTIAPTGKSRDFIELRDVHLIPFR